MLALYALAVAHPDEALINRLNIQNCDWKKLSAKALRLRGQVAFYENAKRFGFSERIPRPVLERIVLCEALVRRNNEKVSLVYEELCGLLGQYAFPFVPIKGISLWQRIYKKSHIRELRDIDIWVRPGDVARLLEILKKAGYDTELLFERQGVLKNHGQEILARHPNGIEIDIHFRLFSWHEEKYVYGFDSQALLENALTAQIGAGERRYLKKEDEFFYLLMLMIAQDFSAYRHAMDADAFVRVYGDAMDWGSVAARIESAHLKNILVLACQFLAKKLHTPIPKSFLDRYPASSDAAIEKISQKCFDWPRPAWRMRAHALHLAASRENRKALAGIYWRWQLFKRFGKHRDFFLLHNNPVAYT